jgi:energy-coupling factor transport system ATP-binding protein
VSAHADSPSAVEVKNVSYTFLGRPRASLSEISFALAPGTITLVAGRTGSGKSTLLRALAGLIPNQAAGTMSGAVLLGGVDTRGASPAALARRAGLVLQSPDDQICTASVESEVAFGLANLCLPADEIEQRVTLALETFELTACRNQPTHALSGGQKQRLLLASIWAMQPRLLLFDEPLAQLDGAGVSELIAELDRLRDQGLTIVVAEHRLDDLVVIADRVLVLESGRLIADRAARDERLGLVLEATGLIGEAGIAARPATAPPPVYGPERVDRRSVLQVKNLAHCFSRHQPPLWQDVHYRIDAGERVAVVGPNGSGKSTLMHAAAGLIRPTAGQIDLESPPPGRSPLALVSQNPDLALFCRTVYEELAFGPRQLGLPAQEVHERTIDAANALALVALLDEPPLALSQGQRLRVAVAATLTLRPGLLLLDEPTTGQDTLEIDRLLVAIADAVTAGRIGAVLFATHDTRIVARFATRALVLAQGRLIADCAVPEFFADESLLRQAGLRIAGSGAAPRTTKASLAQISIDRSTRGEA